MTIREVFSLGNRMTFRHQNRSAFVFIAFAMLLLNVACGDTPDELDRHDTLGLLDVSKAPYHADPTGERDSTAAIQRAVNDARDNWLVCFFPEGTYLISDTISCEQTVEKLDRPRTTDGRTQHYWDRPIESFCSVREKGNVPSSSWLNRRRALTTPTIRNLFTR